MAATRLLMRRLRELLRLKYETGLPHRAIAQACAVGLGTVSSYLARATAAGLTAPRRLSSGSARVAYQLFRDAAFSQSLGIGQSISVSYSDANAISLPIYGRVVLPGNQPGGTYSDTLQVQLSW